MSSIMARAKKVLEKRSSREAYGNMSASKKRAAVSKIADLLKRRMQKKTDKGLNFKAGKNSADPKWTGRRRGSSTNTKRTTVSRGNKKSTLDRVKSYKKSKIKTWGSDSRYGSKDQVNWQGPYTGKFNGSQRRRATHEQGKYNKNKKKKK